MGEKIMPTPGVLSIENYTGVSRAIFTAIGGPRAKTLSGKNASIFTRVNDTFKDIRSLDNLSFGEILSKLYDLLPDVIKMGVKKGYRLIRNIAAAIRNYFVDENKNSEYKPAVINSDIVASAEAYHGIVNSDTQGNLIFSNGTSEAWCADTVSFIYKDLCGNKLPEDFGTCSVKKMREWGINHNLYTETSTMGRTNRQKWILENVKPGDIFVQKRNGESHVGIVTRVYEENGRIMFDSLEGNYSNKFSKVTRSSENNGLSGFISMQQYFDEVVFIRKLESVTQKIPQINMSDYGLTIPRLNEAPSLIIK